MTREEFLEVMRVALEIRLLQTGITLTRIEICEITEYRHLILVCRFYVRGRDEYGQSVFLSDEIFDRQNVHMRDVLVDEILHGICSRIDLQTNPNTNRFIGHPSVGNDPWIPDASVAMPTPRRISTPELNLYLEEDDGSFTKLSKKWTQAYAN